MSFSFITALEYVPTMRRETKLKSRFKPINLFNMSDISIYTFPTYPTIERCVLKSNIGHEFNREVMLVHSVTFFFDDNTILFPVKRHLVIQIIPALKFEMTCL